MSKTLPSSLAEKIILLFLNERIEDVIIVFAFFENMGCIAQISCWVQLQNALVQSLWLNAWQAIPGFTTTAHKNAKAEQVFFLVKNFYCKNAVITAGS